MKVYFLYLIILITTNAQLFCADYTVKIEDTLKRDLSQKTNLLGTNLALWTSKDFLGNKTLEDYIRQLGISDIRIPGGSWTNEYYWNGNGVRTQENFDLSKQCKEGSWAIDYTNYMPGFRVEGDAREIAHYHGDIDVLSQHTWIQGLKADSFVCLNVGSGNPTMAKEWLKWAHRNDFSISRAEIGNELNGEWELGNKLDNGENMTAEIYAEIFNNYSKTLKDYDKALLIGGPAASDLNLDFCEVLIEKGGTNLDFVSFHAYPVPVSAKSNQEKFAAINEVRDSINKIRSWIDVYQPVRSQDIQIGISEWNMKVLEDADTSGLVNGLWSSCWLGTLYDEGLDFANQWDLSTEKESGGHSMFNLNKEGSYNPKSIYWAMWVWENLMGNELINSKTISKNKNLNELFSFTTRGDNSYQIMLVNANEAEAIDVSLRLPKSIKNKRYRSGYQFTHSEYFWNPYTSQVHWSNHPRKVNLSASNKIQLEPFSLVVLNFSDDPEIMPYSAPALNQNEVELEIILPEKMAKNRTVAGWVAASYDLEGQKFAYLEAPDAVLEIKNSRSVTRKNLKFKNGLAHFSLPVGDEDTISIRCYNSHANATHSIELFSQKKSPIIEWTFDDALESWGVKSTFELSKFTRLKPNQSVAACHIKDRLPDKNEDIVFHFEPLTERVSHKGKVNGVFGEISASNDFICQDANARLEIIFQSNNDHWIPMGSIGLNDIKGRLKGFKFESSSLLMDEKLSEVYGLRIRLNSLSKFKGEIYLNDLGFIYKLDDN